MKTRIEQILKKINLSKAIKMDFILWETTIDDDTIEKLRELEYSVQCEHFNKYYYISWR